MKKIEAIIRKTKFEEVKAALLSSDIDWFEYPGLSTTTCTASARAVRSVYIVASSILPMSSSALPSPSFVATSLSIRRLR